MMSRLDSIFLTAIVHFTLANRNWQEHLKTFLSHEIGIKDIFQCSYYFMNHENHFTGFTFKEPSTASFWDFNSFMKTGIRFEPVELLGWFDFFPVGVDTNSIKVNPNLAFLHADEVNIAMDRYLKGKLKRLHSTRLEFILISDVTLCSITSTYGNQYPFKNITAATMIGFKSTRRLHVHFGTLDFGEERASTAKFMFPSPILLVQEDKIVQGCPAGNFRMRWKKYDYSLKSRHSYKSCPKTLRGRRFNIMQA